jgi:putative membrane protein
MPPGQGTEPSREEHSQTLAEDRTVLANERTYTAWVRTGLAALAAGIGFERLLRGEVPQWIGIGIAVVLIGFAAAAFTLAAWRYSHHGMKLSRADVRGVPVPVLIVLSAAMVIAALLALAGMVALANGG